MWPADKRAVGEGSVGKSRKAQRSNFVHEASNSAPANKDGFLHSHLQSNMRLELRCSLEQNDMATRREQLKENGS